MLYALIKMPAHMGEIIQLQDNSLYVAAFCNDYHFDNPLHIKMQVWIVSQDRESPSIHLGNNETFH
jgi:hypothetical protein